MDYAEAKKYAIRRLAMGAITSAKLATRLLEHGATQEDIQRIIEEFQASGYLSDDHYARLLIEKEIRQGHGPYVVIGKLITHGIPKEDAHTLVRELYSDELQQEVIQKLLEQSRYRDLPRHKVIGKLQRRGFSLFHNINIISQNKGGDHDSISW